MIIWLVGWLSNFFYKNKLNSIPDHSLLFITINKVKLVEKAANYTVGLWSAVAQLLERKTGYQKLASLILTAGGVTVLCP